MSNHTQIGPVYMVTNAGAQPVSLRTPTVACTITAYSLCDPEYCCLCATYRQSGLPDPYASTKAGRDEWARSLKAAKLLLSLGEFSADKAKAARDIFRLNCHRVRLAKVHRLAMVEAALLSLGVVAVNLPRDKILCQAIHHLRSIRVGKPSNSADPAPVAASDAAPDFKYQVQPACLGAADEATRVALVEELVRCLKQLTDDYKYLLVAGTSLEAYEGDFGAAFDLAQAALDALINEFRRFDVKVNHLIVRSLNAHCSGESGDSDEVREILQCFTRRQNSLEVE